MKKVCESLREHKTEIINLRKNEFINQQTAKIIGKCINLLFLQTKNLKINMLKIKNIARLGTIVHIQVKI